MPGDVGEADADRQPREQLEMHRLVYLEREHQSSPPPTSAVDPSVAALADSIRALSVAMAEGFKAMREEMAALEQENCFIQQ